MAKTKTYDFRAVEAERTIDNVERIDISKPLGNIIHGATSDIGIDDVARAIYHDGEVALTAEEAKQIAEIVRHSPLLAWVKRAVLSMLERG